MKNDILNLNQLERISGGTHEETMELYDAIMANPHMKEFVDYWGPRTSSKEDFVRSVVRSAFYGYCVLPKEGAPNVYLTERWGEYSHATVLRVIREYPD